jgi:hypothetical protein
MEMLLDLAARRARVCERLNASCFCVTLDRASLDAALAREAGDPAFGADLVAARPHLFCNVPVFLPRVVLGQMLGVVEAIEAAARLAPYLDAALAWAPAIAQADHGPIGAFMGYDFHLGAEGPRLIEVNTNAGGAFLNALLSRAQRACCAALEPWLGLGESGDFETAVTRMFEAEWRRQRGSGAPRRIAIVDDRPAEQYLHPEFVLTRELLRRHGIDAVIADPAELRYERGRLMLGTGGIDLVYNRLVDFALAEPAHAALAAAYRDGAVVVTPNPHNHALLADKRNLTLFSDPSALARFGLAPELRQRLAAVPRTTLVTPEHADALWQARSGLFFKPVAGHGGKAVYRGDKLTRSVFAAIARGGYVAQGLVAPSQRMIPLDGGTAPRKLDVRLYTYDGRLLLAAARLYQGQTTNFRTPGGGFATVFVI